MMIETLALSARLARSPQVLSAIHADDCNLAIWERDPVGDFAPMISSGARDIRFECGANAAAALLSGALQEHGFGGDSALHQVFVEDASTLAHLFCRTLDLARLELRLEVIRTDSCRKFHADYVRARLITTYVGPGTDWLDDDDARRIEAGMPPEQINRMAPFHVGLFKGKIATGRPAIHRSPPLGNSGAARLLLVLNPVQKQFVD